ncbi:MULTISPECIES: CBS domain-containing protein [unclassified Paraburkholderia]|uniref:CBS domain-containing protein n=1 Tax=unclassified Paraburkholderia TaxID=2615204 RepID=UPI002AB65DEF|nr:MULTISPECIES: CBS domain-containing protein [unclassified Paraburkholderia]
MRALDITTESVVSAMPEMTIRDVATLFVDNDIGGLPVIDATGKVVRIVSHSDILHRIANGTVRAKRARWLEILVSSPREQAAADDPAPPAVNGKAHDDAIVHKTFPRVTPTL